MRLLLLLLLVLVLGELFISPPMAAACVRRRSGLCVCPMALALLPPGDLLEVDAEWLREDHLDDIVDDRLRGDRSRRCRGARVSLVGNGRGGLVGGGLGSLASGAVCRALRSR